jgi:hypothetical protein
VATHAITGRIVTITHEVFAGNTQDRATLGRTMLMEFVEHLVGLAYGGGETERRGVFGPIRAASGSTCPPALAALAGHIEAPEVDDDQAPVRRCHRYLSGRRNHLNYHDALANDLPIGSGEIESAHRYIAQQRLKRPGAWWRVDHAEYMLALRIP